MILSEAISLAKERLKSVYTGEEINVITMLLCQHFFGTSKVDYYTSQQTTLTDSRISPFMTALDKLQQHCPIQYVLGQTDFYGYTFKVNESVLIPRPETEELVDWICNDYENTKHQINILDIGTGSGAIAVSLAKELRFAHVSAADISTTALEIAKTNAKLNGAVVSFFESDILSPTPIFPHQQLDIIVSNPPYVRESEKEFMNANVLDYEPDSALFVPDSNPLKFYTAIARFALQYLAGNGAIYLEINEALGAQTMALFSKERYTTTLRQDLNGKDRMLKAVKTQNG